ncbi:ApaG protein [Mariprofundus micogutta]|uniref:Protein ApaG n=1 Tax=Mariprofundus micogutta TaxID=1921010 RepID=A0A1L8CQF3_9PROT|nr:Co2+/Mg2+ efflux protein ApaG [Mariprofundus micogutta]GAV21155.1 ApaG protein [Mariprofundus micogutta]
MSEPCPIIVNVKTEYSAEHSEPDQEHFVFIYYVSIKNRGEQAAQLISRHWIITDGDDQTQEVRGDGVIGEQPVLEPGDEHYYNSFCVLSTRVGCMQGSYMMLGEDGLYFDAPIPAFSLAAPGSLN